MVSPGVCPPSGLKPEPEQQVLTRHTTNESVDADLSVDVSPSFAGALVVKVVVSLVSERSTVVAT